MADSAKGVYSYDYFAAGTCSSQPAPPPKILTEEEIAAQKQLEQQRQAEGTSTWNSAGTFEERSWFEWAKERLCGMLAGKNCGQSVTITAVTDVSGHANAWIVRGKKRHGFDLEFTVAWSWAGAATVKGTCRVPSIASDELDELRVESPEVTTKLPSHAAHESAACKAAAASLPPALQTSLADLLVELRQK
ncbi:hypothetical protein V8C86DRAFT_2449685 [Haematococcus lacustris]